MSEILKLNVVNFEFWDPDMADTKTLNLFNHFGSDKILFKTQISIKTIKQLAP